MPIAAPIIAALIGAGVTGVTTGLEASGAIGGGGGGASTSTGPTPQQAAQVRAQLASLVNQNRGNVAEAGGGSLSPDYLAWLTGSQTGTLNDLSSLQDIANNAGGAASSNAGVYGGTTANPTPNVSIPTPGSPTLSGGPGLVNLDIFGGQ